MPWLDDVKRGERKEQQLEKKKEEEKRQRRRIINEEASKVGAMVFRLLDDMRRELWPQRRGLFRRRDREEVAHFRKHWGHSLAPFFPGTPTIEQSRCNIDAPDWSNPYWTLGETRSIVNESESDYLSTVFDNHGYGLQVTLVWDRASGQFYFETYKYHGVNSYTSYSNALTLEMARQFPPITELFRTETTSEEELKEALKKAFQAPCGEWYDNL